MRVIREKKGDLHAWLPGTGVGDLWECFGYRTFLSVLGGALCFLGSLGECVVLLPKPTLRVHLSLAVKTWGPLCPHFTDEEGSKRRVARLTGVRVGI